MHNSYARMLSGSLDASRADKHEPSGCLRQEERRPQRPASSREGVFGDGEDTAEAEQPDRGQRVPGIETEANGIAAAVRAVYSSTVTRKPLQALIG